MRFGVLPPGEFAPVFGEDALGDRVKDGHLLQWLVGSQGDAPPLHLASDFGRLHDLRLAPVRLHDASACLGRIHVPPGHLVKEGLDRGKLFGGDGHGAIWASDSDRLCKVAKVIEDAGICEVDSDDHILDAALLVRRRRNHGLNEACDGDGVGAGRAFDREHLFRVDTLFRDESSKPSGECHATDTPA